MTDTTIFSQVLKPGRYLGSEYNTIQKDWQQTDLHCALVFPDLYEIGMSHQGLQILYHLINSEPGFLAERCYCPDRDVEQLLDANHQPLTSLESARPLDEFDLIGITLPYELCYTNILTVLARATIPLYARERSGQHPLVLGGGSCALNPEPVADFFDAILLGDGEEAIIDICRAMTKAKNKGFDRQELLARLAGIDGVYVPTLYSPEYDEEGKISLIRAAEGHPPMVQRRVLPDLAATDHLLQPIVPNAKIVHDRLGVEIARGCTRGCRFCQAGMTYRPVRERTPQQVFDLAQRGIDNSGFEELALLSLSTGDYSCLGEVLPQLMDRFADSYVSVAMPSMRVGTLTPQIMDQIKRVRKTGFTLAPEAGSERLRQVINKGITEEDLLEACRSAFSLGWKLIKFYFMIGLPTEAKEDLDAIVQLVEKSGKAIASVARGKRQINVSVGTFVPKPHTPFQWSRQLTIEESRERLNYLRQNLPKKNCAMKWHSPEQSYLEGVFSRGDRRLSALIVAAWQNGARLDGWHDHLDLQLWRDGAQQLGIDLDWYLRERNQDEVLPWHHLASGVAPEFLQEEWQKAVQQVYTPDCRYHGCQQCGLCNFDTIMPIVHRAVEPGSTENNLPAAASPRKEKRKVPAHEEDHFKYLVTYSRSGNIRFLGHLEFLQLIFRGLRRAGITTNFSKGFNPTPKVSFAPALPVGTISHSEFFIMDLPELLTDPAATARLLSSKLPPGLEVMGIERHSGELPPVTENSYTIELIRPLADDERDRLAAFVAADQFLITRVRKGKEKQIDIRPLITEITAIDDAILRLRAISRTAAPGIKPTDALQHILQLNEQEALAATITKTGWLEIEEH